MRSREAWLTVLTAVLGVDATGCQKEGPHTSPAGSVEITAVPSAAPSSSAPVASAANDDASNPVDAALAGDPDGGKRAATKRDAGVDYSSILGDGFDGSGLNVLMQNSCGAIAPNINTLHMNNSCGATTQTFPGIGGSVSLGSSDAAAVPRGDATVSIVSGGGPTDARVVAGLRPGVRACYNQLLNQDPSTPDGRVTVTVTLAPSGDVSAATPAGSLPAADMQCVARRVRNAQFDPPGGSGRTLVIAVDQKKVK